MGICCMAQETQTGALYQPRGVGWGGRWEGASKGRGYMYTYGWFMLRFHRKEQNSVKQLSFNLKINKFLKNGIIHEWMNEWMVGKSSVRKPDSGFNSHWDQSHPCFYFLTYWKEWFHLDFWEANSRVS